MGNERRTPTQPVAGAGARGGVATGVAPQWNASGKAGTSSLGKNTAPAAPRGNDTMYSTDNQYGLPTGMWDQPYRGNDTPAFGMRDPGAMALDQFTRFKPGEVSAGIGSSPQVLASALGNSPSFESQVQKVMPGVTVAQPTSTIANPEMPVLTVPGVESDADRRVRMQNQTDALKTQMRGGTGVSPAVTTGKGSTTAGTTVPAPSGGNVPPRPQFFSPMTAQESAIVADWDRKYGSGRKPL